ncbi:MAG TPA: hypothetical protein VJ951_00120 [Bacteroidales bacterium]|nr:hypothetical protein [Bacteroidales bacterium]
MIRYDLSLGNTEKDSLSDKKGSIDMLTDFEMSIYFKNGKTLVESSMMGGGLKYKVINGSAGQDTMIYVEMMGEKYKVKNVNFNSSPKNLVITDVEIFENDRKVIAGYDVYKVVATMDLDGKAINSVAYITEDFYFDGKINEELMQAEQFLFHTEDLLGIKGTTLEQIVTSKSIMGSIPMRMVATEITNSIDKNVFEINGDEYNPMPLKDFGKANLPGF